jgi:GxxExxY protein
VEFKTDAVYRVFHNTQLLNQLRGTGIRLGFVINFGREKVDYKRLFF